MSLQDELSVIRADHGKLTPKIVLDEARDKAHPLHTRFEWVDTSAAERWRLEQAHALITSVKVIYKKGRQPRTVRAFHAIRGDDTNSFVYEPVEEVAASDFLTQLVRRDMQRGWKQLKARYGHFDDFVAMIREDVS